MSIVEKLINARNGIFFYNKETNYNMNRKSDENFVYFQVNNFEWVRVQ